MDPDGSSIAFTAVLLLSLIFCNAFFVVSETAIVSLNDSKIRKMAQDGNKRAKQLVKCIDEPSNFLATIQIGVTFSGFLASAVAADSFTEYVLAAIQPQLISSGTLRVISLIATTLLLSYVTLVFGTLVPKRIGMQNYERTAFRVVPVFTVISQIEKPFVKFISFSSGGVLRLMGIDPKSKPSNVTEEEIRMLVDVGNKDGNIEEQDKEMIHNIFEFDYRTVEDIMSHRTEIAALPLESTLDDVVKISTETGYSRIPVYREELDNIVGIVYIKDLLRYVVADSPEVFSLEQHMRAPLFILESTTCKKLLSMFQETKIQVAVVVDEYGGTAGMVTMEDLLESIVGNIQDEYDDEEEEIIDLGNGRYQVDGLMQLDDFARFFGLAIDDDDDFDTIGGYLIDRIGQIPGDDEQPLIVVGELQFTVTDMDERRISRIEVLRLKPDEDRTEQDALTPRRADII